MRSDQQINIHSSIVEGNLHSEMENTAEFTLHQDLTMKIHIDAIVYISWAVCRYRGSLSLKRANPISKIALRNTCKLEIRSMEDVGCRESGAGSIVHMVCFGYFMSESSDSKRNHENYCIKSAPLRQEHLLIRQGRIRDQMRTLKSSTSLP